MYDFTQKYNQKDNDCFCVKSLILQYAMQWFLQYSKKILYGSYYKNVIDCGSKSGLIMKKLGREKEMSKLL